MGSQETSEVTSKRPELTPKTLIHQKYGTQACYRIEEVQQHVDNGCPGLVIPQQLKSLYRCHLDLPDLSVTSDAFKKKKDAEQSAAKIAVEKLGIQSKENNPTPKEAWDELVARITGLFTDEFLASSHPLNGHFKVAFRIEREHFGMIPISSIAASDVKVNSLCKIINSTADSDPLLVSLLIFNAAKLSGSVCTNDRDLWIWKHGQYSSETVDSVKQAYSGSLEYIQIVAVRIPFSIEEDVEELALDISDDHYYMDEVAQKLNARDSSHILVSRTVGKASSELKLYFNLPEISLFSDISFEKLTSLDGNMTNIKVESKLNERASLLSGQNIYGDAILANIGFTWRSSDLFYEDVSLCAYYRMLLGKVPDGHYKLSRKAILAAELPNSYTGRSNWKGPTPRELLCMFCRQHRLTEPIFSIQSLNSSDFPSESSEIPNRSDSNSREEADAANGAEDIASHRDLVKSSTFRCEVKILSRRQEPIVECSYADTYRKEFDAIQSSALKVLSWFSKYFKQLDMPVEELSYSGHAHGIRVYKENFSHEFATCATVFGIEQNSYSGKYKPLESICENQPNCGHENGMVVLNIEGLDSGVFPSPGSLVCISCAVALVRMGDSMKEQLESIDELEFEIGNGAVINQLEACVSQLSVNQSAYFVMVMPYRYLVLAAAGGSTKHLSALPLYECFLEYSVKLLQVTEPLEDRMEQAFFSPPLSKQRLEFAVEQINELHATSLVDFGCGSGSLLDSLMDQKTTLETIVGVDISRKSLTRAAKNLHQKLSQNNSAHASTKSVMLYDGSIIDFDCRLYGFDIGTCLEVIEHMEEDQANLFGNIVLSSFCPKVLIVSTPNYEYNPLLQRSTAPDKEDDAEEKSAPCKFRNHDHKFEWTRQQFEHWATGLALRYNYIVEFSGVGGLGGVEPGFASQIAVFRSNTSHTMEKRDSENREAFQPYELIWEWSNQSKCV